MSLQSLDDGLLGQVLGRLPAPSLCAVTQCSRRLRRLASEDQSLWQDAFRRDYPPYFSAQQALLAGASWDWRSTYRSRLQHDLNWKQGQLAAPVETLRSHTGPVFSTAFLGPPFQSSGLALSGGVVGTEERAELTLWDIGRGQYEGVGRLGWQLAPDCMANLRGIFHVQQLPGTTKVVLCGFGSECNIASIEALSECEPPDTTGTLQLLQTLQQTAAQQAQQQAPQQPQQVQQPPAQQPPAQQGGEPQQLQQGQQQGEEDQADQPPADRPSSSASRGASRRSRSRSPPAQQGSPHAPESARRVAAGGVDGQLTYQLMSERMSDLYNWVLRESSNLKFSAVPREQLPPATAGYGLKTDWVLRGHTAAVDLASCQGNCIATVSFDGTAKLWRVPSERPPAGSATASVGSGQGPVPVLSAAATYIDAPEQGAAGAGLPPLCCVTLAADCSQLATGGNDNQVKLWDAERGTVTRRLLGHDGWVWHVTPLQDDLSSLVTGSTDGTVRFWDCRQAGGQVAVVPIDASSPDNVVPVGGLCTRPDQRYIVVGTFAGDMHILDRRQQKILHSFEAHSERVTRLACQGDTILSCSFDGNCRLWQF